VQLPRGRLVREIAQGAFIVVLVVSAVLTGRSVDALRDDNRELRADVTEGEIATNTNAESVEALETILADVCEAAPDRALQDGGVTTECRLAEAGNIEERLPVIEATPSSPSAVSQDQVQQAVDSYLREYVSGLPDDYREQMRAAVTAYLFDNPPKDGRDGRDGRPPTDRQIAAAVAAYLAENPPPPGPEGAPGSPGSPGAIGPAGRGVEAILCVRDDTDAGSHWEVSYSDGSTINAGGPCIGPPGPKGDTGPEGVGISDVSCDSTTTIDFTVTLTDGRTLTFSCGGTTTPSPSPTDDTDGGLLIGSR
jgi:hypothetical protein